MKGHGNLISGWTSSDRLSFDQFWPLLGVPTLSAEMSSIPAPVRYLYSLLCALANKDCGSGKRTGTSKNVRVIRKRGHEAASISNALEQGSIRLLVFHRKSFLRPADLVLVKEATSNQKSSYPGQGAISLVKRLCRSWDQIYVIKDGQLVF